MSHRRLDSFAFGSLGARNRRIFVLLMFVGVRSVGFFGSAGEVAKDFYANDEVVMVV